ncbi:hypothetical protein SAMN05720764_11468 [Fibrobacter sp. UWH5]|nr:hypothetical protein SAMN05720764_11468 [Fibrobacter sp. UWH5]
MQSDAPSCAMDLPWDAIRHTFPRNGFALGCNPMHFPAQWIRLGMQSDAPSRVMNSPWDTIRGTFPFLGHPFGCNPTYFPHFLAANLNSIYCKFYSFVQYQKSEKCIFFFIHTPKWPVHTEHPPKMWFLRKLFLYILLQGNVRTIILKKTNKLSYIKD